eukprot:2183118-Rhodomonas_salina.3
MSVPTSHSKRVGRDLSMRSRTTRQMRYNLGAACARSVLDSVESDPTKKGTEACQYRGQLARKARPVPDIA